MFFWANASYGAFSLFEKYAFFSKRGAKTSKKSSFSGTNFLGALAENFNLESYLFLDSGSVRV